MNNNYKIIGIGGGGNNALKRLVKRNKLIDKNNFIFMNTDTQSLEHNINLGQIILLGKKTNLGLGAGGNIEIGKIAYFESKSEIFSKIKEEELIIILTTLGGGTGTGVLYSLIIDLKNSGNQFVVIATLPFSFEGPKRQENCQFVINLLNKIAPKNSIIIKNDIIISEYTNLTFSEGFKTIDNLISLMVEDLLFDHKISLINEMPQVFISELYKVKKHLSQSVFYFPNSTKIFIPNSNESIIQDLLKNYENVYKINPCKFEELLFYIYSKMGIKSKLTKKSRDNGVDLLIYTPPPILGNEFLTIVQAKRYNKDNKISSHIIRELIGSKVYWKADKAQIITTSDYSKPAIKTAQEHQIDTIKFNDLLSEFSKAINIYNR